MEVTLIKHSLITIGKGLIVILAFLFILTKCGGCDSNIKEGRIDNSALLAKMKSDSLLILKLSEKQKEDSLKTVASKHTEDSIKVIADNNEKLYKISSKKVRELLAKGICDTNAVETAMNDCDSTIKSKDALLAQKDSTNKSVNEELSTVKEQLNVSKGIVSIAQTIIKNQSEDYKNLEDKSNKEIKKQKRKTIGVIILASVLEVLTIFTLK